MKKKDAIIDTYCSILLIETIAGLKIQDSKTVRFFLRNGKEFDMFWGDELRRNRALEHVRGHLNLLNDGTDGGKSE